MEAAGNESTAGESAEGSTGIVGAGRCGIACFAGVRTTCFFFSCQLMPVPPNNRPRFCRRLAAASTSTVVGTSTGRLASYTKWMSKARSRLSIRAFKVASCDWPQSANGSSSKRKTRARFIVPP